MEGPLLRRAVVSEAELGPEPDRGCGTLGRPDWIITHTDSPVIPDAAAAL